MTARSVLTKYAIILAANEQDDRHFYAQRLMEYRQDRQSRITILKEEIHSMNYGLTAFAMPAILDKTVYIYLGKSGINVTKELKKRVKREYRNMVLRTPGIGKGNSLTSTLYIGCYLLAFHKAAPDIIDEKCFEGLVKCLCGEMVRKEKEDESAFSEKTIKAREKAALRSQRSSYEMDWVSTFKRNGKDSYEFTYSKCGLCELGKREGCFHLIKYLCLTDYISFDKGGARLVRDHTIAGGDGYCDFHVYRKEKENV